MTEPDPTLPAPTTTPGPDMPNEDDLEEALIDAAREHGPPDLDAAGDLTCTHPECEHPGPYPDLRAFRAHEASHTGKPCRYCGELFAPQGLKHHENACATRTATERLEAGRSTGSGERTGGRRIRPPAKTAAGDDLAGTVEAIPGWLAGLTGPELVERLAPFVADAFHRGNLAAGYVVVCGPTWGPHLVRVQSLAGVAAGHQDAAVFVLDAGRLAHELALMAELEPA